MSDAISRIVIVGGGTAGWMAACRLAAARPTLDVTLIESPDIATIGVGEGTWPTMRRTLAAIGIGEEAFLRGCDAAFKQGSRFDGWVDGAPDDSYLHPFTPPAEHDARTLVAGWGGRGAFADAVSPQARVCAEGLAPRQHAMPDFAGALNYAYHLDAGKLAALLADHATRRLGVHHVRDHVTAVTAAPDGTIAAVETRGAGTIAGDLFIDCTGHAALLIGAHCGVPFVDCGEILFNDAALAVQMPVAPDSAIAAQTIATAHDAGWIWDIGLPTRRGIGCVWSSRHMDEDAAAAVLRSYLATHFAGVEVPPFRKLSFRSGHRARFWAGNCLAIGLSAGFLEPLEASAIVLIELSLDALIDNFPATRAVMPIHARRFDDLFLYRWGRIIDFLKLHYVLGRRKTPYWRNHRDRASIPPRLADLLAIWRHQSPSAADLPMVDEVFPAASYQYVLYGMGFAPPLRTSEVAPRDLGAIVSQRARALAAALPTNRAYLDGLRGDVPDGIVAAFA